MSRAVGHGAASAQLQPEWRRRGSLMGFGLATRGTCQRGATSDRLVLQMRMTGSRGTGGGEKAVSGPALASSSAGGFLRAAAPGQRSSPFPSVLMR
jgi:hypothetical protein